MKTVQWDISTIQIYLENVNPDMASELLVNKEYLTSLLNDLREDYKMMLADFGETDVTVVAYYIAIQDLRQQIKCLEL